tara:strand:- start:143 stop:703 length:561 start_codon:yes stop_codon:yes gene_type:complete
MGYKQYKYKGRKVPGMVTGGTTKKRMRRMAPGGPNPNDTTNVQQHPSIQQNMSPGLQGQGGFPFGGQGGQQPMDQETLEKIQMQLMNQALKLRNQSMQIGNKKDSLLEAKKNIILNASPNDSIKAMDMLQVENGKMKKALQLLMKKFQKLNLINSMRNKTMIQNQLSGDTSASPKRRGGSHNKRKK